MNKIFWGLMVVAGLCVCGGCGSSMGNEGNVMMYRITSPEPEWIRNGEPIQFEDEFWYPRDTIDILRDSEVLFVGEFRGVAFYIQTADIRPFNRLYTKFGPNKFRVFEVRTQIDKSQKSF